MRFLGVTETCDLAALYLRLQEEGHDVRISVSDPQAVGTLAGMVDRVTDWRDELPWIREAGRDGIILFESVSEGFGAVQDALRQDGYHVIGGSAFGDRLENDRAFAQCLLANLGFQVAAHKEFTDGSAADRYIADNPDRYVLKFSGADHSADDTYVGQLADGADVRVMIASKLSARGESLFILMAHLDGIEMGVGAYFDGAHFLEPACLDWEHKRFFAGDLGELTGEMGTVATFERSATFFKSTLRKLEDALRDAGHVGYVNLNTIVNAQGIWPLEFTCRFGYPGFAVLEPLQALGWSALFAKMVSRQEKTFPIHSGFCVAVVMTTPPFPYSRHEVAASVGLPVILDPSFDATDLHHIHFGEIGLGSTGLQTSGLYGWTMVVTGVDASIERAKEDAYTRARRVIIPNVRYRLDIGDRVAAELYKRVEELGLLDKAHS